MELLLHQSKTPKAKSPSKPKAVAPKQSAFKDKPWSQNQLLFQNPLNPTAAAVAVPRPGSSASGKFLLQADETNEWPAREPKVKLPMWKKKDAFLNQFLNKKVVIAHCPTGSGKSTILPALAAMHLHPKAGRVCCTQIRRVTTQFVCRDTKIIWGIDRDSPVVGFKHGTEKSEKWDEDKTMVLFSLKE